MPSKNTKGKYSYTVEHCAITGHYNYGDLDDYDGGKE